MISECAKMEENQSVVANKWARGNSLLVGLINKLRSKARVATIADKMETNDEKPEGPEAGVLRTSQVWLSRSGKRS